MSPFPTFNPGTTSSVVAFGLIVVVVMVSQFLLLRPLRFPMGRLYIFTSLVWMAFVSIAAQWGWTREFFPASLPLIFVPTTLFVIFFAKSEVGRTLAEIPEKKLILASSFRLPLELVLHSWVQTNTIPETMTWTGSNFDILPGLMALLVLLSFFNRPWFHWIFFLCSSILLLNVMRVVLMSANLPFSWPLENPLQLIFEWPYCLIAVVLVPWAFQLNIALARRLLKRRNATID